MLSYVPFFFKMLRTSASCFLNNAHGKCMVFYNVQYVAISKYIDWPNMEKSHTISVSICGAYFSLYPSIPYQIGCLLLW